MKRIIIIAAMVLSFSGCIGTKIYLGGEKKDITDEQPVSRAIDPTTIPAGGTWGTVRGILNTNFANINGTLDSVEVTLAEYGDSITNYSADIQLRLLKSDTASMLGNYTRNGELNSALAAKVNVSDTAAMLSPYALTSELGDAGIAIGDVRDEIADSLNVLRPLYVAAADTAAMLDPYAKLTDLSEGGIGIGAVQEEIADSLNVLRAAVTVGNGTKAPYFDGSQDGGQILYFYGDNGFYTALQGGAPVANRSYRLPIAALPSAGTTSLMNIDEYGNMGFVASTTYAPTANPTFTGIQKVSTTDTLSTKAYARSVGGGDVSALETRIDSIVTVLGDTANIETILQVDLDTDTLATKAYARSVGGGSATIDSLILNGGSLTLIGDDKLTFQTNGIASYSLPTGGGNLMIQSATQDMISDSLDVIRAMIIDSLLLRSEPIFVFGAGGGNPGDTATFTGSGFPVLGSFNTGRDTLMITQVVGQLWDINTTDTLAIQIMYADSLNQTSFTTVWSSATGINADGLNSTSFANPKIPPRKWVWSRVASAIIGRKPTMINVQVNGYRIKAY